MKAAALLGQCGTNDISLNNQKWIQVKGVVSVVCLRSWHPVKQKEKREEKKKKCHGGITCQCFIIKSLWSSDTRQVAPETQKMFFLITLDMLVGDQLDDGH